MAKTHLIYPGELRTACCGEDPIDLFALNRITSQPSRVTCVGWADALRKQMEDGASERAATDRLLDQILIGQGGVVTRATQRDSAPQPRDSTDTGGPT